MSDENVLVDEKAHSEFDRFVESMELDLDTADMDSEDLTAFDKQKSKILNALKKGSLVINENGEAVYTPSGKSKNQDPITFHERTGASSLAMDGKKKNQNIRQTYAVMADMCKVHINVITGLTGIDLKICEAIFSLLMD